MINNLKIDINIISFDEYFKFQLADEKLVKLLSKFNSKLVKN